MMRILSFIAVVFCCFLAACASQPKGSIFDQRLSTVMPSGLVDNTFTTVMKPDLAFPVDTVFSWSPETSHFFNDSRLDNANIHELLRDSIENELMTRGYRVADGSMYSISYVAALESALSDEDINAHFGINPGLSSKSSSAKSYEKGTVIIDVSDNKEHISLWRTAMQGYVNLEIPNHLRKKRVVDVVSAMFRDFPRAY